ncbi:uncharacterized protein Z518_06697 [Rhinocladiella mackenziei CBS 650.93]|uniref:Uncharacterized protein n=1 Tax=Rhinocladiella mackenziei CBS 650.93 TaxID=1442369 RepID=A0A0D2IIM3_9EURO|nr:uncharacterized protein Z518_06697 [Rhinocladiella mackenziei CBS 650.93]KIX03146.1 hypothetical protein Z518_06697 [Rhinocladiella mackenziei CBS 650.93]
MSSAGTTWYMKLSTSASKNSHIQIVGYDDPIKLQKLKLSRTTRLNRLRSTRCSKSLLAALVKTIHITDLNTSLYLPDDDPSSEYDAYLRHVGLPSHSTSNLEGLMGFILFYNHAFNRLMYAISPRTKQVWIAAENDDAKGRSQRQLPPGLWMSIGPFRSSSTMSAGNFLKHSYFAHPAAAA